MRLQVMQNALRTDLGGASTTDFPDDVLERAISRAVQDMSRVMPREMILDSTVITVVTAEAFSSAAAAGTWVTLANKPIRVRTETVTAAVGGTVYARDTDYTMDYANGRVTHKAGGAITNALALLITYTVESSRVNLASLSGARYKVNKITVPGGAVPETPIDFEVYGDILELRAGYSDQAAPSVNQHVWVYYATEHTPPTATAIGTYPEVLDEVVIKGALLYLLQGYTEGVQLRSSGDLALARTALAAIAAIHTAIATVRTSVATVQAAGTTALNKVSGQLDNSASALANVATVTALAKAAFDKAYLDVVSPAYTSPVSDARTHLGFVTALLNDGDIALDKVTTYLEGASGAGPTMAGLDALLAAVTTDLASVSTYLGAADDPLALVGAVLSGGGSAMEALASGITAAGNAASSIATAQGQVANSTSYLTSMGTEITSADTALGVPNAATLLGHVGTAMAAIGLVNSEVALIPGQLSLGDGHISTAAGHALAAASQADVAGTNAATAVALAAGASAQVSSGATSLAAVTTKVNEADSHQTPQDTPLASAETALGLLTTPTTGLIIGSNAGSSVVSDMGDSYSNLGTALTQIFTAAAGGFDDALAQMEIEVDNAEAVWTTEVNTILGGSGVSGANTYLSAGDDFINQVNRGDKVPDLYVEYAKASLIMAGAYQEKRKDFLKLAELYITKSTNVLGQIKTLLDLVGLQHNRAATRVEAAKALVGMAEARIAIAAQHVANARVDVDQGNAMASAGRAYGELASALGNAAGSQAQAAGTIAAAARVKADAATAMVQAAGVKADGARAHAQGAQAAADGLRGLAETVNAAAALANAVYSGARVHVDAAGLYAQAAGAAGGAAGSGAALASAHVQLAARYAEIAAGRVGVADGYIRQVEGFATISKGYLDRIASGLGRIDQTIKLAAGRASIADGFTREAQMRLDMVAKRIEAARASIEVARQIAEDGTGYLNQAAAHTAEGRERISLANTTIAEADARTRQVGNYLEEIQKLLGQANTYKDTAEAYVATSREGSTLAERLQVDVRDRLTDWRETLSRATSWASSTSISSVLQGPGPAR